VENDPVKHMDTILVQIIRAPKTRDQLVKPSVAWDVTSGSRKHRGNVGVSLHPAGANRNNDPLIPKDSSLIDGNARCSQVAETNHANEF
jgi:hypothetical protein